MVVQKKKYVAYYRVSTQQQGLGLEAQQATVKQFCDGDIVASFTDIESGKRSDNRPQLAKAIELCSKEQAVLIIAKLDRLSRNVEFIASLMNSKVQFKCCDMPEADSFTIHIFAAMAQREREMISQRTKAALKVLKDSGIKLGSPNNSTPDHCNNIRLKRAPKVIDPNVRFIIEQLKDSPLQTIADKLNSLNHTTNRNNPYSSIQVHRLKKKMEI